MKAATRFGLLAIAALVVAAPIATGASRPDNESARVRLVVTQPYSVDNDPSGNSGGDLVGSFGEIHHLGKEIGDYDGACTLASPVVGQCQATLTWSERGTLQLAGNLRLDQQKNVYAIVGGTGEFRGASGSARIKALNQGLVQRALLRILR